MTPPQIVTQDWFKFCVNKEVPSILCHDTPPLLRRRIMAISWPQTQPENFPQSTASLQRPICRRVDIGSTQPAPCANGTLSSGDSRMRCPHSMFLEWCFNSGVDFRPLKVGTCVFFMYHPCLPTGFVQWPTPGQTATFWVRVPFGPQFFFFRFCFRMGNFWRDYGW